MERRRRHGQDETVARAFDHAATDYVVAPFSPTELAARIRAALRRRLGVSRASHPHPTRRGVLHRLRRVTVAGEAVELTATEYGVLYELAVRAPRVLTHGDLRVWGPERVGEPWLLRDVVTRPYRKLGDDARNPRYIVTEHRVGYCMAEGERAPTGER